MIAEPDGGTTAGCRAATITALAMITAIPAAGWPFTRVVPARFVSARCYWT